MERREKDTQGSQDPSDPTRVDLTTTLYAELRKLARMRMAGQQGPQTLQATALLHEAWLKLGGDQHKDWNDRHHYFAAVAETMRHILVDRARRRKRLRHGGGLMRMELDPWNWERLDVDKAAANDEAMLVVNEALEQLARSDPQTAQIINLHYFAGMTLLKIAEELELSERTVRRRVAYARARLGQAIRAMNAA